MMWRINKNDDEDDDVKRFAEEARKEHTRLRCMQGDGHSQNVVIARVDDRSGISKLTYHNNET
jgi:hypothetical protein